MAEESKSWWQTLPGILTAIAGVITAITGFLLAMNQSGCFNKKPEVNHTVQISTDTTVQKGSASPQTPANKPAQTAAQNEETDTSTDSGNEQTSISNAGDDINLLSPENGGTVAAASSDKWNETIDGSEYLVQLDNGIGQQAVYGFKDGHAATFHSFAMLIGETNDFNIKEFELLTGNESPTGKFTSIGKFQTQNLKLMTTPYQSFSFDTVTAKYLKFKLISSYGWLHPAAHEFQLWGHLN